MKLFHDWNFSFQLIIIEEKEEKAKNDNAPMKYAMLYARITVLFGFKFN